MIDFEHKLPAMWVDGKNQNGTYNNTELAIPGILTTRDYNLGCFMHTLRKNIYAGRALLFIDGQFMCVNKNWIRDHVHVMKGSKYFENEFTGFLNFIIDTQRDDGQFYELIKQLDDTHWQMVNEDCYVLYPEDNQSLVRLELEADVEYLVVEGAVHAYKRNADDGWLSRVLPKLEKSIDYITSDPKRWNKEYGLVIRPFTIDTWDFTNDERCTHDRRILKDEPMSAMHGDNTGVYQAMNQLAWFNRRLGNEEKAREWEERAEALRKNIMKHLWNGKHFIHQFHIGHNGIDDKENIRLSLSNAYDMNRGMLTVEECRSIIEEYMARRETTDKFAEWFTIDPPYDRFKNYKIGEYVNGAVSPFTAGELAKAAFNNGYEEYGWDIISRFSKLAERDKDVYFLYYPDSTPQPHGGPSTWGAAALLSAIDEGLAGIFDIDAGYKTLGFSPKFVVTPYTELRYFSGYETENKPIDVRFILKDGGMRYDVYSPASKIAAHILLPKGKTATKVYINGEESEFTTSKIGESLYVDFTAEADKKISIEIIF